MKRFADLPGSSVSTPDNSSSRIVETVTTDDGSSTGTYGSSSKDTEDGSITTGVISTSDVPKTKTTPTTISEETITEEAVTEPPFKAPDVPPRVKDYPPHSTKVPKAGVGGHGRVASETSEIIALVIGIIAGALIAVILVILVILKFTSLGERSYKVDDGKGFQQGPNAALLGNSSSNGQTQFQVNGALRNGDKGQLQKSKKRDSKDIKEWYV